MVDITVQRGNADRPAADIFEPLLATVQAALERGRLEINRGTLHNTLSLTTTYQPALSVGKLVQVVDSWQGTYVALVTGITHVADGLTLTTRLDLWRPA